MKIIFGKPWPYWQSKGKWKYILIRGSIWALFMIPTFIVIVYFSENTSETSDVIINKVLLSLVFLIAFGFSFGWFAWYWKNRNYKKEND
ncbi:MAG: hypothetical protein JEZ03_11205 [Bacteroidales bacterium]|nr:hypothetical protein [Bacteroidales bacterium]